MPEVGTAIIRQYGVVRRYQTKRIVWREGWPHSRFLIRCACNLRGWWQYRFGDYHDAMIRRILAGEGYGE